MTTRRRAAQVLTGTHLTQAAVLLAQPPGVLRAVAGTHGVPPSWIVRVLGVRVGAQGVAEALYPSRDVLRVGVATDVAHALSMLAAARVWPRYRRAALISAASAGVSAALGLLIAEAGP